MVIMLIGNKADMEARCVAIGGGGGGCVLIWSVTSPFVPVVPISVARLAMTRALLLRRRMV